MKKILFITIRYTGTRFFLNLVKDELGKPHPTASDGGTFYHHHCMWRLAPRYEDLLRQGFEIITTVRNKQDNADAWYRRHRNDEWAVYDEQWDMYEKFVLPRAEFIFNPFDIDLREQSLASLNEYLGTNLTTDWEPIGHVD